MPALGMIGPLAGWELRRLVRRGRAVRVWLLFLYTLAAVFVVFAGLWFYPRPLADAVATLTHIPPTEAARFADQFTLVLLEAQLAAVVALTPALAASSVAEEKDRHTLPLLLTTQLTDREIVFGKATGRVAFTLLTVTSSMPLVLFTHLLGGVNVGFLVLGYALIVGTILLCAGIGIHSACRAPDFRSALLRAYFWTAALVCGFLVPPLVLASPFGVLYSAHGRSDPGLLLVLGYPAVQVLAAALLLVAAARSLRLREPGAGPSPVTAYPPPPRPADPPLPRPERAPSVSLPPVDGANPVLWKERCVGWRPTWAVPAVTRVLAILAALAAVALFALGVWTIVNRVGGIFDPDSDVRLADQTHPPDAGGSYLIAAGVFAASRYLLPLVVGLSGAIAGERFRGTLDAILSTPLDRRKLLRAKVQAHAERGSAFVAVTVAAVGMAFTADAGIRLGATAAILVLVGVGLVIGVGAWLTVRCATDVRAFRLTLPVAVLALGWPVGAWNLLNPDAGVPRELLTVVLLVAVSVTAGAGLAFWWLAGRKLERGE